MSKVITLSHQKGGVGKSTLAFNLAQNISKNAKACVVDLDRQGSLNQVSDLSKFDILEIEDINNIKKLEYDFIFIDTPPYLSSNLLELYKISDLIIIPTKAGILDLFAIKQTIELVKQSGSIERAIVVFNMIKPNTILTTDIFNEVKKFNVKIANTMVSDLVAFSRSVLLNGVESSKNAQDQINDLTKEILEEIINK